MSKVASSYSDSDPRGKGSESLLAELSAEFPELAKVLGGVKTEAGEIVLPPCTVMVFIEGDRLKFCLSPKFGGRVAFGTILDPSKGLSGVELALSEGSFEWKARGSKRA